MIEAGSGAKRIELDEDYDVVYDFLSVVCDGIFPPPSNNTDLTSDHDRLVGLIGFVHKYDCKAITALFVQYTKTRCSKHPVGRYKDAFSRLLVAMHLERDDLVIDLFEYYPEAFKWLSRGIRGFGDEPISLPYSSFVLIPSNYLWALSAAEVWNIMKVPFSAGGWGEVLGTPRVRFEHFMKETKELDDVQRLKALNFAGP